MSGGPGFPTLWRVSIEGGVVEQLTRFSFAAASPAGRKARTNLAKRLERTPHGKALLYKSATEGMWRRRLDGGAPERVKGFEDALISQLSWSFNGKHLAYTPGRHIQDILLLQTNR